MGIYCCALGEAYEKERILDETDNFFTIASLGPMGIPGYVLVVSKDHSIGTGDIDAADRKELAEMIVKAKSVVSGVFGSTMVFEHGPRVCDTRGGSCLDHAHIHIVPSKSVMDALAVDLFKKLEYNGQFYRVDRLESMVSLERTAEIYHAKKTSHLYVESPDGLQILTEVNFHLPSQYMRRIIAYTQKIPHWNWRSHPDNETVLRTVDALMGKF